MADILRMIVGEDRSYVTLGECAPARLEYAGPVLGLGRLLIYELSKVDHADDGKLLTCKV